MKRKRSEEDARGRAARSRTKRCADVIGAAAGLALMAPLLLTIAMLVRVKLGAPVIYRQERAGLHGSSFEILKFRTMRELFDERGRPLPDELRVTAFGTFLRTTSLDELPELFNVLRGNMSLVGPRPLLMEYIPRYSAEQARRHTVRPGITGLAQVNGRNSIDWNQKFILDVWYVDNWSHRLDAVIIFKTVLKVLKREGINVQGHATGTPFLPQSNQTGSGNGQQPP